jgi:hypothetical protein
LYENKDKINLDRLYRGSYRKRISKTNVRAKHALKYDFHQLGQLGGAEFPQGETKLKGDFVKREIDESFEKVVELIK